MTLFVRVKVPPIPEALEGLAEGLVRLNMVLMEYADDNGIPWPGLYESGIVYRREPKGSEWWETATDLVGLVSDRSGDCEDLASCRAAELRRYVGEDEARVKVVRTRRAFHAVVERADGDIEDPSRIALWLEKERKKKGAAR